jgi:anti-sigma factor RsiW
MAKNADCDGFAAQAPLYVDDELDAQHTAALLAHAQGCAACRALLAQQQALSHALRANLPRHAPPPDLARRVMNRLDAEIPLPNPLQRWLPFLPPAASAGVAAALAVVLTLSLHGPAPDAALAEEVVAGHVRSLMAQHLTDVASSDQHTVKPWFAGKLDFTLPVRDFAAQGYPLLGGRLDYLEHHTAAALVYGRNKHVINIFVAPSSGPDAPQRHVILRGYNLVFWRKNGLGFEAVSDLNAEELSALCTLIGK